MKKSPYTPKLEALQEVRKNRLNDLCLMGIGFINGTADVVDMGIYKFIFDKNKDIKMMIRLYAVLNKDRSENNEQSVGYYIVWLHDDNNDEKNKWAWFCWVREYLNGVDELAQAIEEIDLDNYRGYRTI